MSLHIPANDFGQIRVFEVRSTLPQNVIEKTPEGLKALFGTDALDPTYIDIIKINDLSSMSLTDYIAQGYDMEAAEHDIAAVNGIEGYAILIMSSAAGGAEVTLELTPEVRHVTTYVPEAQLQIIEPLSSDSAKGFINDPPARAPKSDARIGGMVAMIALIVLFLLVGLMIWVA
jgi:hypothetical protein